MSDKKCAICHELVISTSPIASINCERCKSFYHNTCLLRNAASAAHYFRCAVCNDNDNFPDTCRKNGIYIPER